MDVTKELIESLDIEIYAFSLVVTVSDCLMSAAFAADLSFDKHVSKACKVVFLLALSAETSLSIIGH